jgi:ribosome-binding factor A
MDYRDLRVSGLIQGELGKILLKEFEFPGALVTITNVVVDKKLEGARVDVSILPAGKADEALLVLQKNQGRLQHLLLKKINIKPMPRIRFAIDHGPENAANVEKILIAEDNT